MRRLATLLVALVLANAAQAQDREQLERRLKSVGTLIEASSASRQIESSGEAIARERRNNARLMHRDAAILLQAGDEPGTKRLLDLATREMMNGVRLARPEQVNGAKNKRDFDARLDSARALLTAQQRITQEKGSGAEALDAARRIEALIQEAERMAAAGQLEAARPLADRAYLTARVSIETMRRGDTLVRSLQFASKQEEYEYEVDRNDTHRMLIQVLLADGKETTASMREFMKKSGVLRGEAEALAKQGDHEAAIKSLEESTRELVRAIRAGGIYIPG